MSQMKKALLEKTENRTAVVSVVGLGFVGLPLLRAVCEAGFSAFGIDCDERVLKELGSDSSLPCECVSDFSCAEKSDVVIFCVPTPLDRRGVPELSALDGAINSVAPYLHAGMLVVVESTTYPGYTEERLLPAIEKAGLRAGADIFAAHSPERIDPGNKVWNVKNTPKVVGGATKDCTEAAAAFYRSIIDAEVIEVSSPAAAECEKLWENIYRNVNIALANELSCLCTELGLDVWEVIAAAKTKPYGFSAFYPGLGPGGHCIPLDPWYLAWRAREAGFHATLIENAGRINESMPQVVKERAAKNLSRRGIALSRASVLLLGAAYKADVSDLRESPALKLLSLLEREGAAVTVWEPLVSAVPVSNGTKVVTSPLSKAEIAAFDLVIVGAAHSAFDYKAIAAAAAAILDTKNAFAGIMPRDNIELL